MRCTGYPEPWMGDSIDEAGQGPSHSGAMTATAVGSCQWPGCILDSSARLKHFDGDVPLSFDFDNLEERKTKWEHG